MISPLFTDLYQLTMAYGYWKQNIHHRPAVFQLVFRSAPFNNQYAVVAGLQTVIDYIKEFCFVADDLAYLATLRDSANEPRFSQEFLTYLRDLTISCDIDAIAEGTVVFAQEPLIRIKGPLLQAQILESALLNIINFQTLIATKANRIYHAAGGDEVLEFGLRRAQGPDGALSASRAAYIGGCHATSNVSAGKRFGIPVRGTHAHSWVTVFADELTAFMAWTDIMPNNCVLLVDTYQSVQGIKNAIAAGQRLRERGGDLKGIRLDSGDLVALSIKARAMLDAAGFINTAIVASNNLTEQKIAALRAAGAKINIWGVGTHLVTAFNQPALDGVYKLTALQNEHQQWCYKLKVSEQAEKISIPGIHQVRRYYNNDQWVLDAIVDHKANADNLHLHRLDNRSNEILTTTGSFEELLKPIFVKGQFVGEHEALNVIRQRAINESTHFIQHYSALKYPVGLADNLYQAKQTLLKEHQQYDHK